MKKLILTSVLAFFSLPLLAQTALKSSVSSTGNTLKKDGIQLCFTVGEIAIRECENASLHLSEGFINPHIFTPLKIQDYQNLPGVEIYPNPVADIMHVSLPEDSVYETYLYDLNGKMLLQRQISGSSGILDLENKAKGIYILWVIDRKNHKKAQFKVLKK